MSLETRKIRASVINSTNAVVEPTDDGILEMLAKKRIRDGEEGLMMAVLESATKDFQKYVNAHDKRGKLLFSQAEEWFLQRESDVPFSFESICEVLHIEPSYLRKGLLSWKDRRRAGPRKRRAA